MKKLGIAALIMLLVTVISLSVVSGISADSTSPAAPVPTDTDTAKNLAIESNNALNVRLGQLINLNRVFDECMESPAALIDESTIVLLDQTEFVNGNRVIARGRVLSFIYDLYGVRLDLSELPGFYTTTGEEYFDIVPRGYDIMTSTLTGTEILPDGNIKAYAEMTLTGHDGGYETTVNTETVFVPNPASAFGYNIVSAKIVTDSSFSDNEYNQMNPMDLLDAEYDLISLD